MRRTLFMLLGALLLLTAMTSGQLPADNLAPLVAITAPAEDATLSGVVTVTVDAFDESGIAGVMLEVDGNPVGEEDVAPPWSIEWDASASGGGAHVLTVVARDVPGNAARSDVVPVAVGGTTPPDFPPPVNHNPTPMADSLSSPGRVPVTFTGASLLANDTDPDGHALTLMAIASSGSQGGSISSNGDGTWTYTPAPDFTGTDTFTYTIGDGFGGTASATVSVNVTGPTPAGLVLSLGFDENSGATALDASGGDRHGTISGAERVSGKVGGALRFDGINDWVTVADAAALDLTSGMTLEAWVKPMALSGWDTIVMKQRGANDMSYALYAHDGAPLTGGIAVPAGYVRAGGEHQAIRGAGALAVGEWTHVAATYDGSMLRFYINGALATSRAQAGLIVTSNAVLRIGGNGSFTDEFFEGLIDEVRVYNRALSAAEIAADMGGGGTPPTPPVNTAPVAGTDSLSTTTGTAVSFTAASLLSNDSDADGDPVSITGMSSASAGGGTIAAAGAGSWTYTPPAAGGSDSFTYTIGDGRGGSATGTVNVTVTAPPPPPPPPGTGLVLALGFNEAPGATTASDVSGMGNHGTVREAQFVAGRNGNAMSFDGVNDWVTVADAASLDLTTGMTIEAWVKPGTMSGWETVVMKQRGAGDLAYVLYAHDGAPQAGGVAAPAGYVGTAGAHQAIRGTSALPAGEWVHLAVTYDRTTLKIYVNGVLATSRAQTGSIVTSTQPLRIGGNNSFTGEFFAGLVDEVRVYNRALTPAEIQTDMTTPIP